MRSALEGFALMWLGVVAGVLITWIYQEIRFRLTLRGLLRDAYEVHRSDEDVMY